VVGDRMVRKATDANWGDPAGKEIWPGVRTYVVAKKHL
jgi:hypothetical protein